MKSHSTDAQILEIAANIDLAGKVRKSRTLNASDSKRQKVIELVLTGKTIDEIRIECSGYDDQDILDLVRYTKISLSKMSQVLTDVALKKRLCDLENRLERNNLANAGSLAKTSFISTR